MDTQLLSFLKHLNTWQEIDLGLDRIKKVAHRLNPYTPTAKIITVGGTNGKGSCVYLLESILLAAGYKVGVYTSPHLVSYLERFRINGQEATNDQLWSALLQIDQACAGTQLTWFEFLTLAACIIFQTYELDFWILEVGLGGRLDAVNMWDPDIAVITSIDLDHMDYLGHTRGAIGAEKAGIMRTKRPIICGDIDPPSSVSTYAQKLQAPLLVQGKEFGYEEQASTWIFWSKKNFWSELPRPKILLTNAAVALQVIELLLPDYNIALTAIKHGLQQCWIPGRFQIVAQNPWLIVDVAHNPVGGKMLAYQLRLQREQSNCERTVAIVGMLADKDCHHTIKEVLSEVDEWYTVSLSESARGATAETLASFLQLLQVNSFKLFPNVHAALETACLHVSKNDRIIIFGSFYTVGAAMQSSIFKGYEANH